ncbi:sigma-70 family RNA polymerase sigma factor [bacterium]|nr:sigma-70 family RNA polymerase sigma factor [bacterium]MBP9810890.1 sigma-70 family RNA polymerase sigma factor [bacterium]
MPPTKAIVELGEAILTSPAVKSAAEAAIKAGASLIDDFFSIGGRSVTKSVASGAETQVATAAKSVASGWGKSAERLFVNPNDDKAVTSLISAIESPLQSAAAKSAKELRLPLTEGHRTAMTELAQDKILTTRLGLISGELQPRSVTELQRHLQKSVVDDFRKTFQRFLPGRNEATENLGLLRGNAIDPFESLVTHDRRRIVEEALKTLPQRQAEAIQKKFFDGLSIGKTADAMGVTVSRVQQLEGFALGKMQRPILQEITPANMYSPTQLLRGKPSWSDLM